MTNIIDYSSKTNTEIKNLLTNQYISSKQDNIEVNILTQLNFDIFTNILTLEIRKYTLKHKIVGYKQINYVKYKIYSHHEMNIKDKQEVFINRKINPNYFCNNQLLDYHFPDWLSLKVCDVINYKPVWYNKLVTLQQATNTLISLKSAPDKNYTILKPQLKRTNYQIQPSKVWLHIVLTIFCLGLNWIKFTSKKHAEQNIVLNKENEVFNKDEIAKINELNTQNKIEVDEINKQKALNILQTELLITKLKKEIFISKEESIVVNQWLDLRQDLIDYHGQYDNLKGIYLIWNKTKNQYYVGQSKNIGKRIFHQHFNVYNNDVKNIIFAKDWYNDDEFYYQIIVYGDKETNLDTLEKEYIEKYDSFKNGYNKTGGNK